MNDKKEEKKEEKKDRNKNYKLTNSRRKIMTHILTKTLRSGCLFIAFSLLFSFNAKAQNCATPPTCESLGYTLPEAKCRGVASLKCPFDTTKYYCSAPVLIGDILYSDKSFSPNLIASKTPIGVVFDVENRLAVALDYQIKQNFTGYDSPYEIPGVTDSDGKTNTRIIIDFIQQYNKNNPGEIHYPGVEHAYNYSTAGTSKGDWFLPSSKESSIMFVNNSVVSTGFKNAGKSIANNLLTSVTSTIKGEHSIKTPAGVEFMMPNDGRPAFPVIRF